MGRIRKALSVTSFVATGGLPVVRWQSSAEKAAKEQTRLLQEQNQLLAQQRGSVYSQIYPVGDRVAQLQPETGTRKSTSAAEREPLDSSARATLAELEQRVGIRPPDLSSPADGTATKVCLACLSEHCDERIGGQVGFTTTTSECVCTEHHGQTASGSARLAVCCLRCLGIGCHKTASSPVRWTREESECECQAHHGQPMAECEFSS